MHKTFSNLLFQEHLKFVLFFYLPTKDVLGPHFPAHLGPNHYLSDLAYIANGVVGLHFPSQV